MRKIREYLRHNGSTLSLLLALLLLSVSLLVNTAGGDSRAVAQRTGRRIEKRMATLNASAAEALAGDYDEWLTFKNFPEDMVLYRYVYDTLQSWCNQFTIGNDDIGTKMVFYRLWGQKTKIASPLAEIGDDMQYINLGPKWYLVKRVTDGGVCKVIIGLEISNTLEDTQHRSGVNRHLHLPRRYSIVHLMESGGSIVEVDGMPVFKIISDTVAASTPPSGSLFRWLALMLICIAIVLYLQSHRTPLNFLFCCLLILSAAAVAYLSGLQMRGISSFFSPTTYAGRIFLYSFGALVIVDLTIFLLVVCLYIMRNAVVRRILRQGRRWLFIPYGAGLLLAAATVAVYIWLSLQSLIINSSIFLEPYSNGETSWLTPVVYVTYIGLMLCILLLARMTEPVIRVLWHKKVNVFSTWNLIAFAVLCSVFFTVMSSTSGFRKEQDRMMVLTNRLAIDRDLSLEIQLKGAEAGIADDGLISALSAMDGGGTLILNRLTENQLSRVARNHDIDVSVFSGNDAAAMRSIGDAMQSGVQIAENSSFVYIGDPKGKPEYLGSFIFYSASHGVAVVTIRINPKVNREDRGYYRLLGSQAVPEGNDIPKNYSWAKYVDGTLVSYSGNYAYPTVLHGSTKEEVDGDTEAFKAGGYTHFVNRINDGEIIIASRKTRGAMVYIITFSYLFIVIYVIFYLAARLSTPRSTRRQSRNYYRSRINLMLFISLFATLATMTVLSLTFVNNRNRTNMQNLMSAKIGTIQTMLESKCSMMESPAELQTREFISVLRGIGSDTKSDITLYDGGGKVFMSTTPEVFERMVLGTRLNEDAYYNIKYRNPRFYIHPEQLGEIRYYSLYAPILNHSGKLMAIICSPYTEQNYDFMQDALFHAAAIVNIFILLLAITLALSTSVVNTMFRPLSEMGRKMSSANLHGLEYIIYRRDDEISPLVDAYNRMVHDLSESTKKLTRSERDKAWSEMARQVAHEIKNPLTPIKLEIQRLIRMKQRNDPAWNDRFDEVSRIVLDHIDILTDTANEFSTFAKLYSEPPVEIDLDKTLRDQVYIFDNKENIHVSYIGLDGASVLAPRPQLIRVFVNLITNAVQAVEIARRDAVEQGLEPVEGQIIVSLRNSTRDGWYEIVVEDNGPGVGEENQGRLFTPNFTTKSGGAGLGLAICRNIVEKCGGDISYRRSFALGGACFIVTLAKR